MTAFFPVLQQPPNTQSTSDALARLGPSQKQFLALLLDSDSGLTVDDLSSETGLSRSAVNQHLAALERDGYVQRSLAKSTGGRPGNVYALSDVGKSLFPKQYSWFSRALLLGLRKEIGEERFAEYMYNMGVDLSAVAIPRLVGKTRAERVVEIVTIMNETGFAARLVDPQPGDRLPRISCKNCVYHDLSKEFTEVCRFDLGFLSGLMGAQVEHQECMQRGGKSCRFRFVPPA
ncbi:MarR family transcriptional regulator [Amaricoccus sp.]|uniref:helix-turn-helix transcriptional regulator n=1 Tax=Amaricoccus sp. TaxID=1872485 RepID=UPI0026270E5E|nr:MarR family transcriptional regulator [Amaricoccus sp.]HRO10476.1 MarR family transcriptional regulator [Amaricoccus sp.]